MLTLLLTRLKKVENRSSMLLDFVNSMFSQSTAERPLFKLSAENCEMSRLRIIFFILDFSFTEDKMQNCEK